MRKEALLKLKQERKELQTKCEDLIDCCSTRDYCIQEQKKELASLKEQLANKAEELYQLKNSLNCSEGGVFVSAEQLAQLQSASKKISLDDIINVVEYEIFTDGYEDEYAKEEVGIRVAKAIHTEIYRGEK